MCKYTLVLAYVCSLHKVSKDMMVKSEISQRIVRFLGRYIMIKIFHCWTALFFTRVYISVMDAFVCAQVWYIVSMYYVCVYTRGEQRLKILIAINFLAKKS